MPRRINFTSRKKIKRRDAKIRIVERNGRREFEAQLSLDDYDLDPTALVHVEAYRSVSALWKRFDFGRVGDIGPREECSLEEFGSAEGIRFRVKVASSGKSPGRLLAEVDQIRPRLPGEVDEDRDPIINVAPAPLADEVWKVDFGDGTMPLLLMNERIADWSMLAREPLFRSLVVPAVMRQILARILFREGLGDEEDDTDWKTRWIQFSESLPGVAKCPGAFDEQDANGPSESELEEWIDDAVKAFCRSAGLLGPVLQWRDSGATR